MELTQPDASGPAAKAGRLNWLIVVALLTGPAVLALIGALLKLDGVATGSPLVGGLIGGKKGAGIGMLAGGGSSALYTYKLRHKRHRY